VMATSEKTASSTSEKVTGLQPPAGERARAASVGSALGDAADLITRTRIALVAGDTGRYAGLRRHLQQTSKDLERLETALRPPGETP
jgi:hypothetical protein